VRSLVPTLITTTTYTFFFFSSRRRHTRSKRDWSSDVCSSDLLRVLERSSVGDRRLLPHSHRAPLENPERPGLSRRRAQGGGQGEIGRASCRGGGEMGEGEWGGGGCE